MEGIIKNKWISPDQKWTSTNQIVSYPDFDRVVCEINVHGPDDYFSGNIGFISYDNGDNDVRINLYHTPNDVSIPLPVLLEAIEKARKVLLEEK